jgi:hypothetical protein
MRKNSNSALLKNLLAVLDAESQVLRAAGIVQSVSAEILRRAYYARLRMTLFCRVNSERNCVSPQNPPSDEFARPSRHPALA